MAEAPIGTPLSVHDPRRVGPWTIHSRLGAGGMGVVYHATRDDRHAALKVIRPGLLDAPATRDRFRREVAILRTVRDLHICQFLDADLESEPAWLALEYLSGPVLREEVAEHGPLALDEWWEVARGLAQALSVLEIHRITHRDLKPGNVILNERGPVLIDFGIAHPEDATQLTATGLVTGSPAWLAPEQANLDATGPATDVFTLGSLLAYAATGRPPFGEGASVAVLMSIIKKEPDLEGIDPERTALLRRMLSKDPSARPTAREILDIARIATQPRPGGVGGVAGVGGGAGVAAPAGTVGAGIAGAGTGDAPGGAAGKDGTVAAAASAGERAVTAGQTPIPADATQPGAPPPAESQPESPSTAASAARPAPEDLGTTRPEGIPGVATPSPEIQPPVITNPPQVVPPAAAAAAAHVPSSAPAPAAAPVQPAPVAAAPRRHPWRWVLALLAIAALAVAAWTLLGNGGGATPDGGGGEPSASAEPTGTGTAPPAPSSDELVSGDWLLESYRLDNTGDGLVVSGTVRNRGDATASADLTVWVYVDGKSLGSVSQTVSDVPANGTVPVAMRGDAVWEPGQKVVLLQAE